MVLQLFLDLQNEAEELRHVKDLNSCNAINRQLMTCVISTNEIVMFMIVFQSLDIPVDGHGQIWFLTSEALTLSKEVVVMSLRKHNY